MSKDSSLKLNWSLSLSQLKPNKYKHLDRLYLQNNLKMGSNQFQCQNFWLRI